MHKSVSIRKIFLLTSIGAAVITANPAQASAIFETGNNPQPNEENVLFNEPGLIGSGLTVQGITNQSGVIVNFTGNVELTTPSSGQARIEPLDPTAQWTDLLVAPDVGAFADVILNLNVPNSLSGTVQFTVNSVDVMGNPEPVQVSSNFVVDQGSNFFTISTGGGERMLNLSLTTTVGLTDVRQLRISGAGPVVIPEPGSYLLMISGLLVAFGLHRFRKAA